MQGNASRALASLLQRCRQPQAPPAVANSWFQAAAVRLCSDRQGQEQPRAFDTTLLEFLVCPLSKKPLRYEESTNELINEELGIAYPVIDGIPNMIPQAARMIHRKAQDEESKHT